MKWKQIISCENISYKLSTYLTYTRHPHVIHSKTSYIISIWPHIPFPCLSWARYNLLPIQNIIHYVLLGWGGVKPFLKASSLNLWLIKEFRQGRYLFIWNVLILSVYISHTHTSTHIVDGKPTGITRGRNPSMNCWFK